MNLKKRFQKPAAHDPAAQKAVSPAAAPTLDQLEKELKTAEYRSNFSRVLRSTFASLLVVAAVSVLVAVLLLPVLQIHGSSMTPTLCEDDIVVAINTKKYQQGDLIAFYYNNNILIKRVIATSGDWVEMDENGVVSVNGHPLDEPYVNELAYGECNITFPYQVPDERCFVMGDHRATSIDSRNTAIGCVSTEMIVGRIVFRVWPLNTLQPLS